MSVVTLCLAEREGDIVVTAQIKVREIKHERDNNRATTYGRSYVVYISRVFYNDMDVDDYMDIDDRYIIEEYDGGIRITMKAYKEWVAENGKPQVFHKTDTVGFESPLKEKFEV